MFRILPIAIILMAGFLTFKAIKHNEIMPENDVAKAQELDTIETAAGTPEEEDSQEHDEEHDEKLKGSGHARDGAKEGIESLGQNESGLPDYVSFTPPQENLLLISDAEKELLEKLKIRRNELDEWEKELDLKAGLIEASAKKLDEKIATLEDLKAKTQNLIVEYQGEEDAKIGSLVKIYESMKPKDAAKVFDQMDIDTMLLIIDRMSERKAAPVLAKMNTKRAKQVTERLANQRSLAEQTGIASR